MVYTRKTTPCAHTFKPASYKATMRQSACVLSMPVKNAQLYVDASETNVYTVFVSALGMSSNCIDTANSTDACRYDNMRTLQSVIAGGYCLATSEQVRVFDKYVSHNNIAHIDCMHYPDFTRRPAPMRNICENCRRYDMGVVMTTPDLASFYICRSGGGTPRLMLVCKTAVTPAETGVGVILRNA